MPSEQSEHNPNEEPIRLDYKAQTVSWDHDGEQYEIVIRGTYSNSKNMLLCVAVAEAQRYHVTNANPTSWPGADERF